MTLLTIEQAAARMGTTTRFIRRLVAERRIGYNKIGERYVRIPDTDVDAFIARGRIDPAERPTRWRGR